MTREEIINEIKCLLSELNNGEDAVSYLTQNDVKWLNENIKALEQEPILDKIRAEIEDERSFQRTMEEYDIATGLRKALDILDKHKTESEDKE